MSTQLLHFKQSSFCCSKYKSSISIMNGSLLFILALSFVGVRQSERYISQVLIEHFYFYLLFIKFEPDNFIKPFDSSYISISLIGLSIIIRLFSQILFGSSILGSNSLFTFNIMERLFCFNYCAP